MGNKCNKQQSESEAIRTRIGICPAEVNRLLVEQRKIYEKKCKEYEAKVRLDTATSIRRRVETAQDAYVALNVHLLPIRQPAQNTKAMQNVHTTLSAQASQSAHATQSAYNTPSGHTTQSAQALRYTSFPAQNAQSELNAQSAQNAHATQSAIHAQIPDLQAIQSSLEHLQNALHVLTAIVPATQSAQITQNVCAVQGAHIPQTVHNVANVQAAQTAPNVQPALHAHTDKNVLTPQETQVAQNIKTPQSSHGHLFTHKHGTHCIFTQTEQIAQPMQNNKDALQAQFAKSTLAAQIAQKLVTPQISQATQNEQTHEKPNVTQKAPLTNLPHSLFIYNSNQNAADQAPRPRLSQDIHVNGQSSNGDKSGKVTIVKRAQDTPAIDSTGDKLSKVTLVKRAQDTPTIVSTGDKLGKVTLVKRAQDTLAIVSTGDKLGKVTIVKRAQDTPAIDSTGDKLSKVTLVKRAQDTPAIVSTGDKLGKVTIVKRAQDTPAIYSTGDKLSKVTLVKRAQDTPAIVSTGDKLGKVTIVKRAQDTKDIDSSGDKLSKVTFVKRAQDTPTIVSTGDKLGKVSLVKRAQDTPAIVSTGDKLGKVTIVKRAQDTPAIDRNSPDTVCTETARRWYTNVNNLEQRSPKRSFIVYRSDQTKRNRNHTNCTTDKMTFGLNIYECNYRQNSCSDCKKEHRPSGICGKTLKNSATQKDFNGRTKIVPCPHSNEGCVLHFRESEMYAHIQECPYQELPCPTGCPAILRLKQLSLHFKILHPEQSSLKVGTEIQLQDIDKTSQNVNLVLVDNQHFLLYVIVSALNRKIYMSVQIVSTKFSASKWCYEIHLFNASDGRSFKFADSCTSYFEPVCNIVIEGKCCVIPHAYASNLVKEGVLTYKFFIKKSFCEN